MLDRQARHRLFDIRRYDRSFRRKYLIDQGEHSAVVGWPDGLARRRINVWRRTDNLP
jgi:hypothetical protein